MSTKDILHIKAIDESYQETSPSVWVIDKGVHYAYSQGELAFFFEGAITQSVYYNATPSGMSEAFNTHPYCKKNNITAIFSSSLTTTAPTITLTISGGEIERISILPGGFRYGVTGIIPMISKVS
jgi:hypothetical protein